ncbi:hypothetical protein L484_009415 [Morus notabilis]|uniref:Uncharacterized protein n=1 Tax=Morus notabilis TaxID=981085 RepID=W9QD10_9ROSA|nr:hypothetical protein L484_009415 [Morus notabilis]
MGPPVAQPRQRWVFCPCGGRVTEVLRGILKHHHERYRAFACGAINEEGGSQLILPKNRKRSAMPGRGDGKRNGSEERNWGSQCFSTPNEIRQPRDALLLTSQVSETELNLSLG